MQGSLESQTSSHESRTEGDMDHTEISGMFGPKTRSF